MRRTIYLPDELASQVDDYLSWHPELTFSTLVRQALEARVRPKDLSAFLERAGVMPKARRAASDKVEGDPFDPDR